VRITIVDQSPVGVEAVGWLDSLHRMVDHGVRLSYSADDNRAGIYEGFRGASIAATII
jgi:hypothetical protein